MANKESALTKYGNAVGALEAHIEANKPTFEAHQALAMKVIDAENELRDAVAEDGSGVSNMAFTVTVEPKTQTIYDEEKIKATCPEAITTQQRPPRITISKNRVAEAL